MDTLSFTESTILCLGSSSAYPYIINNVLHALLGELSANKSISTDNIISFMYKNTFEDAFRELGENKNRSQNILRIVYYYEKPIDITQISRISDIDKQSVEFICRIFVKRSIFTQHNAYYQIHEFARKFIIVKYVSGSKDDIEVKKKVLEMRREFELEMIKFRSAKDNPNVNRIFEDCLPLTDTEQLAIALAYNFFDIAKDCAKTTEKQKIVVLEQLLIDYNKRIESLSDHPYVKFQKAAVVSRFFFNVSNKDELFRVCKEAVINAYDASLYAIEQSYSHIRFTKSYAVLEWKYGIFLSILREFPESSDHLERAVTTMKKVNEHDYDLKKMINSLKYVYRQLYDITDDKGYLTKAKDFEL